MYNKHMYNCDFMPVIVYRKSGNFHVKIIHVLNIHINLFLWVYSTHKNILTRTFITINYTVDVTHEC